MRGVHALWLLLLPVACATGDELFGDGRGTSKSTAKSAAQATTSTGSSSGKGGAGGVSSTGGSEASTDAASSTAEASSSSGGNPCMPDAADNGCLACVKMKCCSQLTQCVAEPNCECWAKCDGDGHDYYTCVNMCGQQSATYGTFNTCVSSQCLFECL